MKNCYKNYYHDCKTFNNNNNKIVIISFVEFIF